MNGSLRGQYYKLMANNNENVIAKLPFYLPFIRVYVDDTILAIPEDKIDLTLNIFNSFHDRRVMNFS